MKKLLYFLILPLTAFGFEYEFLTPQTVVIKGFQAPMMSAHTVNTGFWRKENALLRGKRGNIQQKADIDDYLYHTFPAPLKPGETIDFNDFHITYDPAKPTPVFKLNQLGNPAGQQKKYAYIGAWCGRAGALPLSHLDHSEFEIRRASDGKTVFKNSLKLRREDPLYQGKIPFTGEEVLELDYSLFNTPGRYYFYIDLLGRSREFSIGSETVNEAFYIHARGLYHKRCGIAKKKPYTNWICPACHPTVIRGRFPGNDEHYRKGKEDCGFFDRKGNRIEVKHFDLIKQNPPYQVEKVSAPGGWHDAADYDRRPYHLRIVSDLAMTYLMKKENFIDGQLNIPESGNKIPDILDEGVWGLKHLLAVQQANGGVGTWFETTGHPVAGEGLPDRDKYTYYVSAPSRNGTLEFAAASGTLALALREAGFFAESEKYLAAAKKAWDFALDKRNRLVSAFQYNGKVVFYREELELAAEHLLRAGAILYTITKDKKYLAPITAEEERILKTFDRDFWKWSTFSWMILELYPAKELAAFRNQYRKVILRNADRMLADQENAYPYRTLWHAHDAGWVHAMAWGNYHPLRRAMTLVAAHRMTGDEKYLTGAYLANDFHNGANPLGRTMTSGLGAVYPAVFLDLISYADGIGEFVPGITPYGNTFGVDRNAVKMVYNVNADLLPIWRRYINLEFLSVPSSEYSVWETIAPAAVTSGYLIEKAAAPLESWKNRMPADDFRKLPGYRALP